MIDIFLEEDFSGDCVRDQRERSRGWRHQAQVQVVQREQQREECERKKGNAGEKQRAGEHGANGSGQT